MWRKATEEGQDHIEYDPKWISRASPDLFDPRYLEARGMLSSVSGGRGTVRLFSYEDRLYALRHYYRGGCMARPLGDRYLWTGPYRSRPAREARLLRHLARQGLPVPHPVAWRVVHDRLVYRADLIVTGIASASSLTERLRERAIPVEAWEDLGASLRRFHNLQVWHADLNLGNIMIDAKSRFFLIDFDRCRILSGDFWKRSNLRRLHRSCLKERSRNPGFRFRDQDFDALLRGYARGWARSDL